MARTITHQLTDAQEVIIDDIEGGYIQVDPASNDGRVLIYDPSTEREIMVTVEGYTYEHNSVFLDRARTFGQTIAGTGKALDLDNGAPIDIYQLFALCTHRDYDHDSQEDELVILDIARAAELAHHQHRNDEGHDKRTGWWVYLREDDLNHDNENQEPDNPFLVITDADDYAYLRCLEDQDDLRPDEPESVKRAHAVISYITEIHGIDAHLIEDVVELKE